MTAGIQSILLPRVVLLTVVDDIRDVKGPLDFPVDYAFLFIVLGVVLLAGIVWFARFLSLRKKQRPSIPQPLAPPWELAWQRLMALQQQGLAPSGKVKEYYTELSDIIRRYLEDRFSIRAPEMTTPEFLSSLRSTPVLTVDQKEFLREFLSLCDMVKFAKFSSTEEEMERSFALIQELVTATKPKPEVNPALGQQPVGVS